MPGRSRKRLDSKAEPPKGIKQAFHILGTCIAGGIGFVSGLFKMILAVIAGGLVISCIAGGILYMSLKTDIDDCLSRAYDIAASMQEGDFMRGQDTYVYDAEGNTVGIINAGHFEYVDISHISEDLQNLYISQEDKRFKEHFGVDLISTARAGLALIKNRGEITQGGSTITQQVIKNTYLTQEQSFKRKLIEILVAPQLELKFTKPKIMEFYCNSNYYGNRCYGVQAASKYYFGTDAENLTVAQAAMLVGLSNAPSTYDPVEHPDAALEKRNEVIENGYANGYLTAEEKEAAIAEPLTIVQASFPENMETYQSSYAVHCAALALMEKEGFPFQYTFSDKADYDAYQERYSTEYNAKTEEVRSGGYKIYTSLDPEIQNTAQETLDNTLARFTETQENGKYALQGAAAITDNQTGYVVAVIGGRGMEDQYNRAYLSARQPGSCIKPLIDYAPAFDTGAYWPGSVINDHKFEDGPDNAGSYYGNVTIREALNRSLNTVAWQVLQNIGVDTGLSYLDAMKFQKITYVDNDVPALSIGGFTDGLRVVDMAKGYQTLANNGVYDNKTCIIKIEDAGGNVVYEGENAGSKKVYEPETAYMITDILKGTFTAPGGTGRGLGLSNMPAAGKTGTTNSNKDTWFCGYSKYYTMSVWVGYDTPRAMPGTYGADYAGSIWQKTMQEIHKDLEPLDWDRPETVVDHTENGITDLYSSTVDIRKAQALEEKLEAERQEAAEATVAEYEKNVIASVEDTYVIESDFQEVNNIISQVNDSTSRKELYDRAAAKRDELIAIRNSMADEIAYYESRKEIEESEAAAIRESQAEEDRKNQIKETRISDFEDALEEISSLGYIPENMDELTDGLMEKLDMLSEYDEYISCADRATAAINALQSLPSEEEYNERLRQEQAAEESRQAEQESQAEEARQEAESAAKVLDNRNNMEYGPGMVETKPSPANTTGPTRAPENYGPGYEGVMDYENYR